MPTRLKSKIDQHIARRIRERRIMQGISQGQAAKAIGVSAVQFDKYESAMNGVGAGRLFDIAAMLSTPVAYFYEGVDLPESPIAPVSRRVADMVSKFGTLPPPLQEIISHMIHRVASALKAADGDLS